jgi:APA family basic amino acid/polyamine antiporter
VLGLFDSTMIVVGSIIGSGVFLKASTIAKVLPSTAAILAVWIGIGIVTLCGSLALGELAAMLPEAGGPYIYLRESYGKLPAFLWGWTEFWIVRTASLGALSAATVLYLNVMLRNTAGYSLPHAGQAVVAMLLVIFLSWINIMSTRWSARVQNLTGVIKVAFLAALIVLPFCFRQIDLSNLQPIWPSSSTTTVSLWRGIGLAVLAVMWPYDGWINIAPVAEEIRDPQRNVPKALALGMGLVILIYVAANSVYHLVLPFDVVKNSEGVAADVWKKLFEHKGVGIAAAGVMCSTFGAVNSNMLAGPRIYFAMARDRLLPEAVSRIHSRYETPHVAVVMQGAWTLVLIAVAYAWKEDAGDAFDALTDFAIFGGTLFYAMSVGAVYVLRRTRPNLHRPYRTWGYPFTPALYLLTFFAVAAVSFAEKWQIATAGTSLIFAGAIYYAVWNWFTARRVPTPIISNSDSQP